MLRWDDVITIMTERYFIRQGLLEGSICDESDLESQSSVRLSPLNYRHEECLLRQKKCMQALHANYGFSGQW